MIIEIGDPYINLMLATLALARADSSKKGSDHNLMWDEFKHDFPQCDKIKHPHPRRIAEWVIDFIKRRNVADYCQSVRAKDIERERVNIRKEQDND